MNSVALKTINVDSSLKEIGGKGKRGKTLGL